MQSLPRATAASHARQRLTVGGCITPRLGPCSPINGSSSQHAWHPWQKPMVSGRTAMHSVPQWHTVTRMPPEGAYLATAHWPCAQVVMRGDVRGAVQVRLLWMSVCLRALLLPEECSAGCMRRLVGEQTSGCDVITLCRVASFMGYCYGPWEASHSLVCFIMPACLCLGHS